MTYFKKINEVLLYFDIQPLLFFWISSDVLNNQVLWTTYSFWKDAGQPYTYWLYMSYLIISLGMMYSIHKIGKLSNFVLAYLVVTLFSTIRYLVDIFLNYNTFNLTDIKNITITLWYAFMWSWIYFKLKNEILHRSYAK